MTAKGISIEFDEASLRRFYRRIDPDNLIRDPVDRMLSTFASDVEMKAEGEAPVDTGRLKKSIKKKKSRGGYVVVVEADYGLYVHEGTRPHWPPVAALAGWAERHGVSPYAVAWGIAQRGTRAQPFLRTAFERARRALPIELQSTTQLIETTYERTA